MDVIQDSLKGQQLPVAVAAIVCCFALMVYHTRRKKSKIISIPGYPLIGNMFDMDVKVILDRLAHYKEVYGNVFHLQVFSHKFLHVSDPKLVREIMAKRPKVFKRGIALEAMANKLHYLPFGLFHAHDAQIWGKVKKLTAPAFSKQNLTNMSRILYDEALSFVDRINELSLVDADIDFPREAARLTTGVINKVAFGDEQVDYFIGQQFYEDVNITLKILLEAALFPFPEWIWQLTPMYKNELLAREADVRFTKAAQEVIDRKRVQHASMDEDTKKELHSLIDIMLRQDDVQDLEILANVKTFYVAGSDTTSVTISWALYLLLQNPDCVAKIRTEAAKFFNAGLAHKSTQEIGDALMELQYTTAVFKEAVRLYPVGPLIFLDFLDRSEAVELSDGVVIEPDRTVLLQTWTCHLDEVSFPQAKKFVPARWLTEDKALLGQMENAFLGFGAGTRACPGMNLALREGALALATLFHHFDLKFACPVEEIKVNYLFTMQPNKLPLRATKRVV